MQAKTDRLQSEIERLCRSYDLVDVLALWFEKATDFIETYPIPGRNFIILRHVAMLVSIAKVEDVVVEEGFEMVWSGMQALPEDVRIKLVLKLMRELLDASFSSEAPELATKAQTSSPPSRLPRR